jgi:anti-sigma factor RsiW
MPGRRKRPTDMRDTRRSRSGPPIDESVAPADEVTCREFVEIVTDYFEGALSPRTQTLVEEHLVMCDWCVTYAEQMQATIDSLHGLQTEVASAQPSDRVLAALKRRREDPR